MKNKSLGVVFLAVIILALVGFFILGKRKALAPMQSQGIQQESGQAEESALNSIGDAIAVGQKMKCTYSSISGDSKVESVSYIDGEKYKSTTKAGGQTVNSYFDGKAIYSWIEGQMTGTMTEISCMEEFKKTLPQEQQVNVQVVEPENQFKDAMDMNCLPSTEADLSVPKEVTFVDQCENVKKSFEMMKDAQKSLPANIPNLPNGLVVPQ